VPGEQMVGIEWHTGGLFKNKRWGSLAKVRSN